MNPDRRKFKRLAPSNIVMIEDNEADIVLVKHALKKLKNTEDIKIIKDGDLALQYIAAIKDIPEHQIPNIVLLDINLPKISGEEIYKKIKSEPRLKKCDVFILLSSKNTIEKYKSTFPQATDFIEKPLDLQKTADAIANSDTHDLSICKNAISTPNDWENRYQELKREYEQFSYIISHDLQAPLRQINGFTNIMMEEFPEIMGEDQELYKKMLAHSIDQANGTISALLIFSRLNTCEKKFEKASPSKLIDHVITTLNTQIIEANANITIKDLPEFVRCDKILFEKIVTHLLENSIKFRKSDTELKIKISCTVDDDFTTFCIKDNGIGIEKNQQEIALTILRKLSADEDSTGYGVGLNYAKKIAEIHGGKLWIESKVNKGTEVYFSVKNFD
ncbi:MAG: response regulator [Micavibrio sp.]|nr:response regulator [Micavibrio sp.]